MISPCSTMKYQGRFSNIQEHLFRITLVLATFMELDTQRGKPNRENNSTRLTLRAFSRLMIEEEGPSSLEKYQLWAVGSG